METWRTLSTRTVYENAWIRVREDDVIRPNGEPGIYGVVEVRPSVFIVALTDAGEVVLVTQERYTTEHWSVEIPAGNSDGQDPLEAAQRELREETGYEASEWTPLGRLDSMNGICTEQQHVFLATGLTRADTHAQEEDGITAVQLLPMDEVREWVRTGRITDGQTVSSLALAWLTR